MLAKDMFDVSRKNAKYANSNDAEDNKQANIIYDKCIKQIKKDALKGYTSTTVDLWRMFWFKVPTLKQANILKNKLISEGFECRIMFSFNASIYNIKISWEDCNE